jgi:hypothetical protein
VKKINFDVKIGFIAPLTNHGTLMVNNFDTSCYAETNSHYLADLAMTPAKLWYNINKAIGKNTKQQQQQNVDIDMYSNFLLKIASNLIPSLLD